MIFVSSFGDSHMCKFLSERKLALLFSVFLSSCSYSHVDSTTSMPEKVVPNIETSSSKEEQDVLFDDVPEISRETIGVDNSENSFSVLSEDLRRKYIDLLNKNGLNVGTDTALLLNSTDEFFIVVNIPSQTLRVFRNSKEILRSPVIVGSPSSPTPTFETYIEGVRFNPSWTIPPYGRLEKVYTKKLEDEEAREYLRKNNIFWKKRKDGTYSFYQPPGDNNALGQARFLMPSPYNVYFHDTNRRDLFEMENRYFSAGCVRVKHWDYLASIVLDKEIEEIYSLSKGNNTLNIRTSRRIPVYIVYWTVEMMEGRLYEYPDPYKKGKITIRNLRFLY